MFNDSKNIEIDKINNSGQYNLNTVNKFTKVWKEFHYAQDLYVKSLMKINSSFSQLSEDQTDFINPVLSFFSITFCIFMNVQNEFALSLNKLIKILNSSCETEPAIYRRIFNTKQQNIITDFKNASIQLNKAKQKYFSFYNLNNGMGSGIDSDKNEKALKRSKEQYQTSITNYNKTRTSYLKILDEGLKRSKENQFLHLDTIKKCIKYFGNALAKLVFDLKDSVDATKQFYKTFNKEELFDTWTKSNKTTKESDINPLAEAVMEFPENSITDDLIDCSSISASNQSPMVASKQFVKNFNSRKESHNNGSGYIIDQDIPDIVNQESCAKVTANNEKMNVSAMKNGKRKWSMFSSLMKFKSTSSLVDENKFVENLNVDSWQSRSNLNASVLVDEEGFIIREPTDNDNKRETDSSISSDLSQRNEIKGLKKLIIKPMNEIERSTEVNSELMQVALRLPMPKRENFKIVVEKRVSNLQRSARPVSYLTKDKLYRRSMSVSEIQRMRDELDSPIDQNMDNKDQYSSIIPVACAFIEVVSSDLIKDICTVQGQITVAFPLSFKQMLQEPSMHHLPQFISFKFVDHSHQLISAQITNQLEYISNIEQIESNVYLIKIITENLRKSLEQNASINTKFDISNRMSLPIFEYLASISNYSSKIIDCQGRWASSKHPNVQFDFILSSPLFEQNKSVIVKVKLLTEGVIEEVFSKDNLTVEKLNDQYWKMNYDESNKRISIMIRSSNEKIIKLRMNYDFTFENFSLINPEFVLVDDEFCPNINFKISFRHYRTISTGNFSQIFEHSIS